MLNFIAEIQEIQLIGGLGATNRRGSQEVEKRKPQMAEEKEEVCADGSESQRGSEQRVY